MTNQEWEVFYKHAKRIIDDNLKAKGAEYAPEGDRFRNFHIQARKRGTSALDALDGNRVKHEASLEDMRAGLLPLTKELIDEKCKDDVSYALLQWGLFYDEIGLSLHEVSLDSTMGVADVSQVSAC